MKQERNYWQKIIGQLTNTPSPMLELLQEVPPLRLKSVQNGIFKLVIILFQILWRQSLILDTHSDMLHILRLCWFLVLAAVGGEILVP